MVNRSMLMTKKQVAAPFTCANGFVNTGSSCIPANVKCYGALDSPQDILNACTSIANGLSFDSYTATLTINLFGPSTTTKTYTSNTYWYCPSIISTTTLSSGEIGYWDISHNNGSYQTHSVSGLLTYGVFGDGKKNHVYMDTSPHKLIYYSSNVASGSGNTYAASGTCTQTTTPKLIKNFGSYRAWNDGTYASSCNQYKDNSQGIYDGQTGDGIYRILLNGSTYDVYCLMTYNTNGWIRVAGVNPGVTRGAGLTSSLYSTTAAAWSANAISGLYPLSSTTEYIVETGKSGACSDVSNQSGKALYTGGPITWSGGANTIINAGFLDFVVSPGTTATGHIGFPPLCGAAMSYRYNGTWNLYRYADSCIGGGTDFTACPSSDYLYLYLR